MKITKKGYQIKKNELSESERMLHIKKLTAKAELPKSAPIQQKILNKPFPVYQESKSCYYFPKFYGINEIDANVPNEERQGDDIDVAFNGKLRDYQKKVIEASKKAYNTGGGILSLGCGKGKTCLALYLIALMKKKTLVIVHKQFLMDQWKERIEQFLPTARIGIIQQDNVDIENKDIVLGMLQSISMKEYHGIFDTFGHIIVDECHHIAAKVFSRALFKTTAKYTLGLTATPDRKDKLTWVLKAFLGEIFYEDHIVKIIPKIRKVIYNPESIPETHTTRDNICLPRMITDIVENNHRTAKIIEIIRSLKNRKIIVLSERRGHLECMHHWLSDMECGFYMGGMKKEELQESETKQIIFGTFSMAAEGLDIPDLDTLILASPKSDVKQSVGRILRKQGDNEPLVIDIVDNYSIFLAMWRKRNKFYKDSNYNMEYQTKKTNKEPKKIKKGITLFLE